MCGRYVLKEPLDLLQRLFAYSSSEIRQLRPRYNIAPTTKIPVVRCAADGTRELVEVRWGLIPSWAKDPATLPPMINARSESVAAKPSFRTAFKSRRCLIPASGYYEWQKRGTGPKQPFYFHARNNEPLAFAGLWESWRPPEGDAIVSAAIVTCAASAEFAPIHDRMPVLLTEAKARDEWLSPRPLDEAAAAVLMRPAPAGVLEARPIATRVNSVRNDDPSLIES
jgi:putative SOS response-associated peptidase YedK